jgi:thiamine biosynthesis lipoprotein
LRITPKHRSSRRYSARDKWFAVVEQACSRFDPNTELRQLLARPGETVQVSPVWFEAVRFAVHLARTTGGAFDPTVGRQLEQHGFNRHYLTGAVLTTEHADASASFRNIRLGTAAASLEERAADHQSG